MAILYRTNAQSRLFEEQLVSWQCRGSVADSSQCTGFVLVVHVRYMPPVSKRTLWAHTQRPGMHKMQQEFVASGHVCNTHS